MRSAVSAICAVLTLGVISSARAGDPSTKDCLSASEASLTLRGDHKLRAARTQATTCSSAACPAEVRDECMKRVAQLTEAIPMIVFEVKDGAGNDLTQVKVTMDGELLVDKIDGTALALDPGEHKFVFETAGQPPLSKVIVLREGDKQRHESVVLGPKPADPPPAASSPGGVPLVKPRFDGPGDVPADRPTGSSTMTTVGWVVGGIGLVGLGLGTVFGLSASSSKSDGCGSDNLCDPKKLSSAKSAATLSTVGFVAGGLLVVGGISLVLMGSNSDTKAARVEAAPFVGATGGGFVVRGSL